MRLWLWVGDWRLVSDACHTAQAHLSSLATDDCDEDCRMMCHRVGQRQLNACVHGFCLQARTLLWRTKTLLTLKV